jgi:anaerobic magnesium-protoporphyrin IX monomethyl ester cyclase
VGFKVLLIYPNQRGMNMLPPAIGLLSSILKNDGVEVRLFDTTYYENASSKGRAEVDSDKIKTDKLMARPYDMPREITLKTTDVYEDFKNEVENFGPDLLAISCTEDMFLLGIRLLRTVRQYKITTIIGGVFATFAPDLALRYNEIDIVCKGEGEDALRTLCERMRKGQSYDDVPNLWIKEKDGNIKKNPTKMVDMDANPLIDMSIFEDARYYRPMGGKVYRMFPVETFRGCPYKCAFCNSPSQEVMYRAETGQSYIRRKSFENMRRELLFYKEEMQAEYLYFWADTFFTWKKGEFEEFAEIYKEINLPFWCQTRIETVRPDRMKLLRDIGCARISFGIEHGNEQFRREHIKRPISDELMVENFKVVKDSGIPFSVNNIIGFPHETYDLAFDTVRLNTHIEATDRNAYPFTPFHGTPLREECERLGYLDYENISHSLVVGLDDQPLSMPQFPREKVNGLIKTFNMYVNFPESRWGEIRKAEAETDEGRRIYDVLKAEYVERFWKEDNEDFEAAALDKGANAPMN